MKEPAFNERQIDLGYEIGYSQGVILFDILIGLAFLIGGIALAYWIQWWGALVFLLGGLFAIWQAVDRGFKQGPQLKINDTGIWTVRTGYLLWTKAFAVIKMETNGRGISNGLIILNRAYPEREIARLSIRTLDVDARMLQAYLNRYSSKRLSE